MHSHTCCIYFQMYPQNICTGSCKVTQVAFSWLFPTVPFKMSPQIAYLNGCKVTLVAFVWLFLHCAFSDVSWEHLHWKMHSHAGCTFFYFFPTVCFRMSLQIACLWGCKVTLVDWIFSSVCSPNGMPKRMHQQLKIEQTILILILGKSQINPRSAIISQWNISTLSSTCSGENLHMLTKCKKLFNQASNVSRHLSAHTGERPSTSLKCRKSLPEDGTFNLHNAKSRYTYRHIQEKNL